MDGYLLKICTWTEDIPIKLFASKSKAREYARKVDLKEWEDSLSVDIVKFVGGDVVETTIMKLRGE